VIWNSELEQSVLSCLMLDPVCELETLSEDDFADGRNKKIFRAIKQLHNAGKNIDHVIVYTELKNQVKLDYLMSVGNMMPSTSNYETYLHQLQEMTKQRKLYYLADEIMQGINKGTEGMYEMAVKRLSELKDTTTDNQTTIDIINEAIIDICDRMDNPVKLLGLASGFKDIDRMTDGIKETDYFILAARPSLGKSALAFEIASKCSKDGKPGKVDVYCMEMNQKAVYKRMLLAGAGVSSLRIRTPGLSENEKVSIIQKVSSVGMNLLGGRIRVNDKRLSISEIRSLSRKRKEKEGLDLIIIDYIQLAKSTGKDRFHQVTNISMEIREMIQDLRVPVLALAQLNREAGGNKIPSLKDLRESGQLEQDGDIIALLHREDYFDVTQNKAPMNEGEVDLIFAKQRDNPVGVIKLGFIKNCTKFVDIDKLARR
jgi:replicative DNA helicase